MIETEDRDFSINGKQAEKVVEYYYQGQNYNWNVDTPFMNYLALLLNY